MFSNVLTVVWPRSTEDIKELSSINCLCVNGSHTISADILGMWSRCTTAVCCITFILIILLLSSSCLCHFCRACSARMTCGIWSLRMFLKEQGTSFGWKAVTIQNIAAALVWKDGAFTLFWSIERQRWRQSYIKKVNYSRLRWVIWPLP